MSDIGGNTVLTIQKKTGFTENALGEKIPTWADAKTITGWLDLMGGSSGYSTYNAKIQESTHVFLCDYTPLGVNAENARAVIGTKTYDVMLIDNPMEMGEHMEIFLKYTGGQ